MNLEPLKTFPKPHHSDDQTPLPLLPSLAPVAPYPVNALPPLLQEAALAIAHHVQAPQALAGQCVIGAAAYLAQTRVNASHHLRPEGMPCSLFMLTLANSGDRKSECRRLAFKEIDEHQRDARNLYRQQCDEILAQADRLKGKKREEFLADNPLPTDPRTQYSDATFEPIAGDMIRGASAACWDTDEGGQLFGGASLKADTRASTIGGLIKAFDNGIFERTRSRGNVEGSGFAYNRRLSILLLAQPVTIAEALSDPLLREQGFLPRFLFSSAETLAGTRFLTPEKMHTKSYGDPRLQRFWERCQVILKSPTYIVEETGEVLPPPIQLTEQATEVWLDFYNETEQEQGKLGEFCSLRAFAGRAGELARRVAAVFACFEQRHEIDDDLITRACQIVRHSLNEWRRYSEEEKASIDLIQAADLMEWLKDPIRANKWQEFHRNELGKSGPGFVRIAGHRDKLLSLLIRHRHLISEDGKQYVINPFAEVADTAENQPPQEIGGAETVRNDAEIMGHEPPDHNRTDSSATFRKTSAPLKTVTSRASANSAVSANTKAGSEKADLYQGVL
jgi:hypothetical protein|tara:strand:- start:10068 stop:11756 length:1689 start_codon:yes stop_codon:yes gene_type:complete